ncbi:unnamed protein product [Cyclocybe aegerita]|uniref:Uncharacterized protein n=1 Tax=Cyclocybe aegerita TaxID=1973307 RepID=A0A8S0W0S6_CYCAE|nr:unnamed protein product [Cyclocybe aegerita]
MSTSTHENILSDVNMDADGPTPYSGPFASININTIVDIIENIQYGIAAHIEEKQQKESQTTGKICADTLHARLSVCRVLQEWFEADDLCRITFVYVPSALRWDIHGEAHKYVTELKVRVGRRKTDNSIDTLRSRAVHSVLDSWSSTFQDPTY